MAPYIVPTTTYGATSDYKVGIMITLGFSITMTCMDFLADVCDNLVSAYKVSDGVKVLSSEHRSLDFRKSKVWMWFPGVSTLDPVLRIVWNPPTRLIGLWLELEVQGVDYFNITVVGASATETTKVTLDDVIKWKHFARYWPFVREIHRSPVNSPHKGQ